ncbi:phenylalanine--tRNA ligase subunit beta [Oenococcus sicerae]|uniref:phenylalanine--tRNA ligase subunit beta n=1 Tax=Oenococcus sicerae TaxID=2203724 RepID=UPI0039ED4AB2
MKVSVNWIKEYIPDFPVTNEKEAQDFSDTLALTSTEVEENGYQISQSSGLIVGKITEIRAIENSTHLKITIVNTGKKDYQIVTGAPNAALNQLVVLALPGAVLAGSKKIEATTLDGQISQGMLVSLQEIAFDDSIAPKKHEAGIYVFPADNDVQPGDDAVKALGIDDLMIDTELTANRGDMLSIRGNLYEFAAILNKKFVYPEKKLHEGKRPAAAQISASVDSKLANPYYLRVINDVTVKESPLWLQRRLWNSGIRPINNLVDVTNYIMLLFGQPMHAFDLDQLQHKQIKLALSKDESLTTLDGNKHDLKAGEDIVVYDGDQPQMLAGVMGGVQSEVTQSTKNLVLEAAVFDPVYIRKTAQRFNLHSQASQRFERGIDVANCQKALDYAAALVQQIAGGEVAAGVVTGCEEILPETKILISVSDINDYLGSQVSLKEVREIWDRLAFKYDLVGEQFTIYAPKRRPDITIKADLIEEFVRIYGYDKVPTHLPQAVNDRSGLTISQKLDRAIRQLLLGLGLNQAISYSLTDPDQAKTFTFQPENEVKLSNPMSQDRSVLRQSLLSTLIQTAAYNAARKAADIRLFETGAVFFDRGQAKMPKENHQIAALISGIESEGWQHHENKYDFYYMKGLLQSLLDSLDLKTTVTYKTADDRPEMHPGQTADVYLGQEYLGFVGQINPKVLRANKLAATFVFQIDLDLIHKLYKNTSDYSLLDKFPGIERDLSLLVDDKVESARIENLIKINAGPYLRRLQVVDVYEGLELGLNKKSIAYRLEFVNPQATLVDDEVNQSVQKIIDQLARQLQARVR